MKRGTPEHPKMYDLAKRLNIDHPTAVGIMELLWHFTAKFAPRGDIGRFTDEAIAAAIHWQRPTGRKGVTPECTLSDALVDAKWVDRCPIYRLVVHDWPEHADQAVRKLLSRQRLSFVRTTDILPEPEPEPEPEPTNTDHLRNGSSCGVPVETEKAIAPAAPRFDFKATLERLREIYRRAGVPIPPKHEQLATQLILALDPAARSRISKRLPDYCMWALATGRWRNAATTKTLVNVIRDGDWDVEITPRELPDAASHKRPNVIEQQEQEYLRRHSKGAS